MKKWHIFPGLCFLILIIFFGRGLLLGSSKKLPSVQVGKSIPIFELPLLETDATGLSKVNNVNEQGIKKQDNIPEKIIATQEYFNDEIFRGKISLLHVWASWCDSCVEEQKFLMGLSQKDISIYGLNYKDDSVDAFKWLERWGNPFKAVGLDQDGVLSIDLGVYGTPETFLIDQNGIIRLRYAGIMNTQVWDKIFSPLIENLKRASNETK